MGILKVDGAELYYYDNEATSPNVIVFIHGNSHSSRSFRLQYAEERLQQFRLIGIDLPGHGLSSKYSEYSIGHFVDALVSLIDYLKLEQVILVGHSLGGHVAIEALTRINPEGIMIFGAPPFKKPIDFEAFKPNKNMTYLHQASLSDSQVTALLNEFYDEYLITQQDYEEFRLADEKFRPMLLKCFIDGQHQDEVSIFNGFEKKKAIVYGDRDRLLNRLYIESVLDKKNLWKQGIVSLDSTHNLHIESASEFNELLIAFSEEVFETIV